MFASTQLRSFRKAFVPVWWFLKVDTALSGIYRYDLQNSYTFLKVDFFYWEEMKQLRNVTE